MFRSFSPRSWTRAQRASSRRTGPVGNESPRALTRTSSCKKSGCPPHSSAIASKAPLSSVVALESCARRSATSPLGSTPTRIRRTSPADPRLGGRLARRASASERRREQRSRIRGGNGGARSSARRASDVAVRPLDVIDREHDRLPLGDSGQELAERLEDARAELLRRAVAGRRRLLLGCLREERHALEDGEEPRQQVHRAGAEPLEQGAVSVDEG